jgi:hypothetical protein
VIDRALSVEKLRLGDVGQIVANPEDAQLMSLIADHPRDVRSARAMTGDLGASALLTEIALALHHTHTASATPGYTLLVSHSRAGHWGALLLASETMEEHT